MLIRYVFSDLIRNTRRTLSTMVGVSLGVGLFCGVLFFVDGLSASMTQRAVAPLPIDMQRIVSQRVGGALSLTQQVEPAGLVAPGQQARVLLEIRNTSDVAANEVTVRSLPGKHLPFVLGSATLDGAPLADFDDNPLAHGAGKTGYNLGTIQPGGVHRLSYLVGAGTQVDPAAAVRSWFSSRESVTPIAANQPPPVPLDQLAELIEQVDGVAYASPLSFADLASEALISGERTAPGPARIFGFDAVYADRDDTIVITEGTLRPQGALLSAEAANALNAGLGDTVTVTLPDQSSLDVLVTGISDLTRARALFSSRRGADLETFIYRRNSIVVSPEIFADIVMPAYGRIAADRGARLKNPPIREVDVALDRELLDGAPAAALIETRRIGKAIQAVASHQDFLLDNISNTLHVAAADAETAKRLFVFLGVPGGLLAAMLAAYAASVLAAAQRREQATLRIRGATRAHLLKMLALRTGLLTGVGSVVGLALGYFAAVSILGRASLDRAGAGSLAMSALLGTIGGFLATGASLYITGHISIDRQINEDRARLAERTPLWRRAGLDIVGTVIIAVGTVIALRMRAFDGVSGSVYFGRGVDLNLALLVLPVAVWMTGSLLAARLFGAYLARSRPNRNGRIRRPLPALIRLSVCRRPWAIGNGAVVVSLIVALATSLTAFTASYDRAKAADARYANGSDIRVTPAPTALRTFTTDDAALFTVDGVAEISPVIYGVHNAILRSARTSDPANLAAVDPWTFGSVAPLADSDFVGGDAAQALRTLQQDSSAILVSADFADFLKAKPGDTLNVLLVRGTREQVEVTLHITGLFQRLPGSPDGAQALMSIHQHTAHVPTKLPDFFLAATADTDNAGLQRAMDSLQTGPGSLYDLRFDSRANTLARDQSSLAALNVAGLVSLDSTFALSMAAVTIGIFVFGLLLQRRREYITLRAQGLEPPKIRLLISAEAAAVAVGGAIAGALVGAAMGFYFVTVLRPLFVHAPTYTLPLRAIVVPVALVFVATVISSIAGSRLVNGLDPTELLRDE